MGVKILFENKLIEKFIDDREYDELIKKAILLHNKYQLDTNGLTEREILHAKIIRDSDKIDSFYNKINGNCVAISHVTEEEVEHSKITNSIYETFMNHQTILSKERKTPLDIWISYMAFVFDFNYIESLIYIKERDYMNKLIDRFNYFDLDSKIKIEEIRKCALDYINKKVDDK